MKQLLKKTAGLFISLMMFFFISSASLAVVAKNTTEGLETINFDSPKVSFSRTLEISKEGKKKVLSTEFSTADYSKEEIEKMKAELGKQCVFGMDQLFLCADNLIRENCDSAYSLLGAIYLASKALFGGVCSHEEGIALTLQHCLASEEKADEKTASLTEYIEVYLDAMLMPTHLFCEKNQAK